VILINLFSKSYSSQVIYNHMIYNRNLNTFGFVTKINDGSGPIYITYQNESLLSFWYVILYI